VTRSSAASNPGSTPAGQYAVVTVFMDDLSTLAAEPFCHLTAPAPSSGRPHTIEIWFALHGATVDLLSGGGQHSDWVKNLQREPTVELRIGTRRFTGRARVIDGPCAGGRVGAPPGDREVPARLRRRPTWLARGNPADGHRPEASPNRPTLHSSDRVAIRTAVLACRDTPARVLVAGPSVDQRCALQLPPILPATANARASQTMRPTGLA
jgi:hypothetical protein